MTGSINSAAREALAVFDAAQADVLRAREEYADAGRRRRSEALEARVSGDGHAARVRLSARLDAATRAQADAAVTLAAFARAVLA